MKQKKLAGIGMHIKRVVQIVLYEQNQIKIKHTQSRVKETIKQLYMTKRDGYMIYIYTTVHARFPLVFGRVRVTRSLVLCVCCVFRCLSFCTFPVGHCVVYSSNYGSWLPPWYLQTLRMQCLSYMIKGYSTVHARFPSVIKCLLWNINIRLEVRMEL